MVKSYSGSAGEVSEGVEGGVKSVERQLCELVDEKWETGTPG